MTDDFFKLRGTPIDVGEQEFLLRSKNRGSSISDIIYRPGKLSTEHYPRRTRIRNINFSNMSFAKTEIILIEFEDCSFDGCLFMGAVFTDCRFTNCNFHNCNTHRVEFKNTYVDPVSFADCIQDISYANVGIYLFHELLRNSRSQSQPDFSDSAQFYFRRWQRYGIQSEIVVKNLFQWTQIKLCSQFALRFIYEIMTGSGVGLRNFFLTILIFIPFITTMNWIFIESLGLQTNTGKIQTFVDAFYFTVVTLTTLGYGDVTPTTPCGRIVIAIEALCGFVLLAILTSMIYRKISA